ncbi:MAG: hypothetical protein JW768_06370 [Chitinispirillaceae bacterium]|nr:hypothetical protein [Chitinispirillaceae bacterium]
MMRKKMLFSLGFIGSCTLHAIGQPSDSNTVVWTTTGVETTVSQQYFKMGDIRLIHNDWGSREHGCTTPYRVFIEKDGTFGWEFNRGTCGTAPDFPEVEFGIHPFGHIKDNIKTGDVSSTSLLPLQIKNINSASIKVDQMKIDLQSAVAWNICFEMWLTTKDPATIDTGECPYAEIMAFWGWQDGRWACDQNGTLTAGTNSYHLCHSVDIWACGWRYIQFRVDGGPMRTYNGTLNVKAMLDWLVTNKGMSRDLWVTRFEIGSEINDNTRGKITIKNLTFEVNGVSKSPEFRDPTAIEEKPSPLIPHKPHATLFPAGTSVEIVTMQGARKTVRTGAYPRSAAELGKNLPKGIYLMYRIDGKGAGSKKAIVVPVL